MQEHYIPLRDAAERISDNDPLAEELLHYTLDIFLSKKNVESIIESGGGRFFCVKIMMNSWKSVTSPFFYTYRKHGELESKIENIVIAQENDNELEIVDRIKYELEKLPWYDKMLFKTFVDENHTISSLSRATGIPRTSISLSINRIRKHIKRNL
jgi:hypothetical protein